MGNFKQFRRTVVHINLGIELGGHQLRRRTSDEEYKHRCHRLRHAPAHEESNHFLVGVGEMTLLSGTELGCEFKDEIEYLFLLF